MKHWLTLLLVVVLAFLQYELWLSPEGVRKSWHLHSLVSNQKSKNGVIEKQNDQLAKDAEALRDSNAVVEDQARNNLGMIKRGEKFYRVIK